MYLIEMNIFGFGSIRMNQLYNSCCDILGFYISIIFTHFGIELTNIDELIIMDLFLYLLLSLENGELFFKVTSDTVKLYMLLF